MEQRYPNRAITTRTGQVLPSVAPEPMPAYLSRPLFPAEPTAGGLAEVGSTLLRHAGLLAGGAVAGLVLAIVFSLLQSPLYKAKTSLLIQNPNIDFLNTREVNPVGPETVTDNGLTDITTQIEVISSAQVLDRVVKHLQASGESAPIENQIRSRHALLHKLLGRGPMAPDEVEYAVGQKIEENLTIKQIGPTRAVEISFVSTDPKFAAAVVNSIASEYMLSTMEGHLNKSKETEEWLTRQLGEMRDRLQASEDELQAYARNSGLLFASTTSDAGGSDISASRLSQLQVDLSAAQNDRVSAQSRYEIARAARPADLPDVLNDPRLRTLQDKLTDLERERAELLSTYTVSNERVRKIDSQIPPLQEAYTAQRNAILSRIHDDFTTALRREELLRQAYSRQAGVVVDKTDKAIKYGILKRQVESDQQLYASVLQQVKRAGVASTMRASNIEVFDPARAARKPFSPNIVLNSGFGLIGGILASLVFIYFAYSGTMNSTVELESKTGLRQLGVIPSGLLDVTNISVGRRLVSAGRAVTMPFRRSLPTGGVDSNSIELAAWSNKQSLTAESFRSLLTSILFTGNGGSKPKTLLLTSANMMEGKTTLTCNLGISMAQLQGRVLLVDADLRKPRLHQIFNLDNNVGLSTILSDPSSSGAVLENAVQATFVPGLFVLPAGPVSATATNLLHGTQLNWLLTSLRKRFDTIIIDTPPTLVAADARLVARVVDGVIVVVRAGRTPWEDVQSAIQQFDQDGVRVMGTVLNDARRQTRDYAYYQAATV